MRKLPLLVERKAIVVPGDVLAEGNFKPGDYVVRIGNKLFATQIGLVEVKGNTVFVVPLRGKYIPRVGDLVIGTIVDYSLTSWKVDINSAYLATLPVDLAINKKFDIIFTDLAMPGISGLEVSSRIRKFRPYTPIILLTGWEAKLDSEQLSKSGITNVLYKPFRIEQLTDMIKSSVVSNSLS